MASEGNRGGWYNDDHSPKLALEFGGGMDVATSTSRASQMHGWNVMLGGGYNWSDRFGTLLEYSFHHADVPAGYLNEIYPVDASNLIAHVHLWSITAEPTYHYINREHGGGYVFAGGGFYRKTIPLQGGASAEACRQYVSGCLAAGPYSLSNNAGGVNVGTGVAWRPGTYSNAKLFLEARYVWVDNQSSASSAIFPPANQRTTFIPISGGLRW